VGDFNGDGIPDLATANSGTNNVTVLLGNGSGGFAPMAAGPFAAGSEPAFAAVGDFNGDGIEDLAAANAGSVTILLGAVTGQTAQTITFAPPGTVVFAVSPLTISATASSGLPVSFASITTSVCAISGNTVTMADTGVCTIVASQPGNSVYAPAASVTQSFAIIPSQAITFEPLPSVTLPAPAIALSATATSGLPVSFTTAFSYPTQVCTVSGTTLTILAAGTCTVIASQPGNGTYTGASDVMRSFTVYAAGSPVLTSAAPASAEGTGMNRTFTFTFSDSAGWQSIGVVDVLINNFLNGQQACYIAVLGNRLYLVDDAGDGGYAGGSPVTLGAASVSNSQCTVNASGSSASGGGNTLTLMLNITFTPAFAGSKVVYLAARDNGTGNSGWVPAAAWTVPGTAVAGPSAGSVSPAYSSSSSQTYTFTFTDTNGWQDIAVANILVNNALDGRGACYLAFAPSGAAGGALYLVDDAGDGGGPYTGVVLPGSGTAQNGQCTVNAAGSSVSASGNTLTLTLAMSFSAGFAGNQIFYLAARSNTVSSGWQALGEANVP
jgi:hypothetical protein